MYFGSPSTATNRSALRYPGTLSSASMCSSSYQRLSSSSNAGSTSMVTICTMRGSVFIVASWAGLSHRRDDSRPGERFVAEGEACAALALVAVREAEDVHGRLLQVG